MSNLLKNDLLALKNRLETIETQIEGQMKDLEEREEKWKRLENLVQEVTTNHNDIIQFNVGGKHFATKVETLLKVKDTLFYKMILSNKFNLKEEIFFDRSPKLFPFILDYLRYGKINYKRFNREELEELKIEAEYYEIHDVLEYSKDSMKDIEFVNYEFSGPYIYNNSTVGTNNLEDIKDRTLTKGICANTPGYISFELNREWEFEEIELGGWNGNSNLWYNANGGGAKILTSVDKVNWNTVGTIPSNFGSIQKVKLSKSTAKYIKFDHNSYLGIGYLHIKKLN